MSAGVCGAVFLAAVQHVVKARYPEFGPSSIWTTMERTKSSEITKPLSAQLPSACQVT